MLEGLNNTMADFFLLSGLLLIVIFFVSPSLRFEQYTFCLGGAGLILLSLAVNRLGRKRSKSKRFQTLRKLLGDDDQEGGG